MNNFFYYLLSLSQVLPQFVFNSRDPIVMGVMIEAGIVKEGTPICVPSKNVSIFCNFHSNCHSLN
jgi:translation initiation factor IF-2